MSFYASGDALWVRGQHARTLDPSSHAWTPLDLKPKLFARADYGLDLSSGAVSRWNDASTFRWYMENATSSERPTPVTVSGVPALQCNLASTQRLLGYEARTYAAGNSSYWSVFRLRTVNNSSRCFVLQDTGQEHGSASFGSRCEFLVVGAVFQPTTNVSNVVVSMLTVSDNVTPLCSEYLMASGAWSLANSDATFTATTASLMPIVGARQDSGSWLTRPADVDLFEVGFCDFVLSSTQRTLLSNYLAHRYSL